MDVAYRMVSLVVEKEIGQVKKPALQRFYKAIVIYDFLLVSMVNIICILGLQFLKLVLMLL